MCAALWPPGRTKHREPCSKRGAAGQTLRHELYECPHLYSLTDPTVTATQHLGARACNPSELECLWLRGLMPSASTVPRTPCPDDPDWRFVGYCPLPNEAWPGGT